MAQYVLTTTDQQEAYLDRKISTAQDESPLLRSYNLYIPKELAIDKQTFINSIFAAITEILRVQQVNLDIKAIADAYNSADPDKRAQILSAAKSEVPVTPPVNP